MKASTRWNLATVSALALAAAATLGVATLSSRGQAPPTYRQQRDHPQVSTFDVVEARKFVLRDESGLVRMEIGPNRKGNSIGLRFFDRQGTIRLTLAVAEDGTGSAILLSDQDEIDRVVVTEQKGTGVVEVEGTYPASLVAAPDGRAGVMVRGATDPASAAPRAFLGVDEQGHLMRSP